MPVKEIGRLYEFIEAISRLVERISRIINSTALTAAEMALLEARLADLVMRYVPGLEQQLAFLDELAALSGVIQAARACLTLNGGAAGMGG